MRCSEYQILLSAYVDGELSPQEEKKLLAHLEECDECKKIYEAIKYIADECRQTEEVPLPTDFHQSLMTKIRAQENKMSHKLIKRYWKWQYSGGLVATIVFGVLLGYQLQNTNQQNSTTGIEESYALARSNEEVTSDLNVNSNVIQQEVDEEQVFNLTDETMLETQEIESNRRDLSKITPISVELVVENRSSFEEAFEAFLIEQNVNYEKTIYGYDIERFINNESLNEWFSEHCEAIYWNSDEESQGEVLRLEVKISELP